MTPEAACWACVRTSCSLCAPRVSRTARSLQPLVVGKRPCLSPRIRRQATRGTQAAAPAALAARPPEESGAGYMEGIRLDPDGGEWPHDPGDAGPCSDSQHEIPDPWLNTGSGYTGTITTEGSVAAGTRGDEGFVAEGTRGDEGSVGAGTRGDEGSVGAGTRGDEGPVGAGTRGDEGPVGAGTRGDEGSVGAGTRGDEGSVGAGTRGDEGSVGAGTQGDEGPVGAGTRGDEGSFGSGTRGVGWFVDAGTRGVEGSVAAGTRGTGGFVDAGTRGDEGSVAAGTWSNEGSVGAGTRGAGGFVDAGTRGVEGSVFAGTRGAGGFVDAGTWGVEGSVAAGTRGAGRFVDAGPRGVEGSVFAGTQGAGGFVDAGTRGAEGSVAAGTQGAGGFVDAGTRGDEGSVAAGTRGAGGVVDAGTWGDEGSVAAGTRGDEGSVDAGTRGDEGSVDAGPRGDEGSVDAGTRGDEGSVDAGTRGDEGSVDAGTRGDEGSVDAGTRGDEGSVDAGTRDDEGSVDAGTRGDEGSVDAGTRGDGGSVDAGTRGDGGSVDAGTRGDGGSVDAGTQGDGGSVNAGTRGDGGSVNAGTRADERSFNTRVRDVEGFFDTRVRDNERFFDAGSRGGERSFDAGPRSSEESFDARSQSNKGSRVSGTKSNQSPRDAGTSSNKDTSSESNEWPSESIISNTKASIRTIPNIDKGSRNSGARDHEESLDTRISVGEEFEPPRRRIRETTNPLRTNAESQWVASFTGTKGSRDLQHHGNKASFPYGTNPSQKLSGTEGQLSPGAIDGAGCTGIRDIIEGSNDSWSPDSFKKPILPARSGGHEKAVEQRDKPASSSSRSFCLSTRVTNREASADASHRLPSDAYRSAPAIPYREPSWSGRPQALYSLEMLKGGNIVSSKSLNEQNWIVFGRLPSCHAPLEHPSVSRYHAVLQYRQFPGPEPGQEPGFYIYDLDSTHGTYLNKQRIPPKTYCRFRVGHLVKFGGSTRLFILQGPDDDKEEESELTVTQLKEERRQKEILQRKMLGDDSDEEDLEEEAKNKEPESSGQETGCMWGMGDDAMEEENDENPIALEFQEDREALYLKDPKKALKGFFDREGEELEYEYEERGLSMWLCRVRLPADDSSGKQLVAEIIHTGKKKDAAKVCALEACRMLDMRGLFRQEAVSRKRKSKQWEAEDFYDSDDDTFLDRTGLVEKKRLNRMKKAGKIEDKAETYDSLVSKLDLVEKELSEIDAKLKSSRAGEAHSSEQADSLDAFMTEIKSGVSLDAVSRKKLHLQSFELKKEQQRLKGLIKMVQPTKLPELLPSAPESKTKKLSLPMFGAMKGGSKFKLKTGTVGKLPPKRTDLPVSLFTMKDDEPEEEEEEENMQVGDEEGSQALQDPEEEQAERQDIEMRSSQDSPSDLTPDTKKKTNSKGPKDDVVRGSVHRDPQEIKDVGSTESTKAEKEVNVRKQKKVLGPSRPPATVTSSRYPEDDPEYSVWTPPAGQTGDGRTHLNEKYGY